MTKIEARKPVAAAVLLIFWTCRAFTSSENVLAFFNRELKPDQVTAAKVVPTSTDYEVFYPYDQDRHPRRLDHDSVDLAGIPYQACSSD